MSTDATTEAATLTEFLLARIVEDEAAALTPPRDDWPRDLDWTPGGIRVVDRRWLAECEAKRQVVEQHDDWGHVCPGGLNRWGEDEEWIGCPTLLALALPYASHPDYDEEWRP